MFRRTVPLCLSLGITVGAGACSTADYSRPVNQFATATAEAQETLSGLNTLAADAYTEIIKKRILERRLLTQMDKDSCLTDSMRCRLAALRPDGTKWENYPPDPPLAQTVVLMSEINAYAANLKSVVEADTASKVSAQVNATLGSIQNLAETVAELDGEDDGKAATVPQFATPAGAAVNWIVGHYVETVKFSGLKHATAEARPVIRDAADLFSRIAGTLSVIPKTELAEEVSSAADVLRTSLTEQNLARLQKAAAEYDALLTSAPPEVFTRLGDAHDALAASLQGETVTFGEAVARIERFSAEVGNLAQILRDLRAIVPEDGED